MTPEVLSLLQAVLVATITAAGTVIGMSLKNNKNRAVHDAVEKERFDRLEEIIHDLKRTQEKHNNLIERVAVLERDNKTAFNRIDELREEFTNHEREDRK